MAKVFNVTAVCRPEKHYMVNIDKRLADIKKMIDDGQYFTINRARQYGKTTTLRALSRYLRDDYYVVSMDFQSFGNDDFENENVFSISFAENFIDLLNKCKPVPNDRLIEEIYNIQTNIAEKSRDYSLKKLFTGLSNICEHADKPIVLMIDEVDSASNNEVFLDFLAQIRAQYIDSDVQPTFQSVILAGVYDIKNLKRKLRPDEAHSVNSPWNIASDFRIDMSLSKDGIAGMLEDYESDYHTGMDIDEMAGLLYDYTSGYPFLVSRLCKLIDEEISGSEGFETKSQAWTKNGFIEAVKMLLIEKNTLFESLVAKLTSYPELNAMLRTLLFTGKNITYNPDEPAIDMAVMFGFVKNQKGSLVMSNRIFETRLYNLYLSSAEMQGLELYKASLYDRNQFIVDGHLNMRRILEKFAEHFNDLYGSKGDAFVEDEGRKYFLLYLRPIINGTGNYYIESRTRDLRRTDVIVDYNGEQYIIEMKIWRGDEYNIRGEKQLVEYLDDYHKNTGYMVSFNFNKNKVSGVKEIVVGDKHLFEVTV